MSFDRLARHYDWMELLLAGERLQRMRVAWLEQLRDCSRILSAGEGHGRFAAACAARYPDKELTCLDSCAAMLARARHRLKNLQGNVHWLEADLLDWTPPARQYDAIVTCFSLDCFTPAQLASVIGRLGDCATERAVWLVSDFRLPPRGPARWRARAIHALMYRFFKLATRLPARRLTPPDDLLKAQGFVHCGRCETEWGLLYADHWRRLP